jgi:hypothetical protein
LEQRLLVLRGMLEAVSLNPVQRLDVNSGCKILRCGGCAR